MIKIHIIERITVFTDFAFIPASTPALVRCFKLGPIVIVNTLSTVHAWIAGTRIPQICVKHRHNECTNQQTIYQKANALSSSSSFICIRLMVHR